MADHGEIEYATATGNDLAAHEAGYQSFVHAAVVGTIGVVNIVLGLAIGGVNGSWLAALLVIFVIAPVAVGLGLKTGSTTSSVVALLLSLLLFAFSA